jgi:hypothetical protein
VKTITGPMVSHKAHFVVIIWCHFGLSLMTKQAFHTVIPGIDLDRITGPHYLTALAKRVLEIHIVNGQARLYLQGTLEL